MPHEFCVPLVPAHFSVWREHSRSALQQTRHRCPRQSLLHKLNITYYSTLGLGSNESGSFVDTINRVHTFTIVSVPMRVPEWPTSQLLCSDWLKDSQSITLRFTHRHNIITRPEPMQVLHWRLQTSKTRCRSRTGPSVPTLDCGDDKPAPLLCSCYDAECWSGR